MLNLLLGFVGVGSVFVMLFVMSVIFNWNVRTAIGLRYREAGWNYVYHITSSEHGDRPGLTHFIFSMERLDCKVVGGFYIV